MAQLEMVRDVFLFQIPTQYQNDGDQMVVGSGILSPIMRGWGWGWKRLIFTIKTATTLQKPPGAPLSLDYRSTQLRYCRRFEAENTPTWGNLEFA